MEWWWWLLWEREVTVWQKDWLESKRELKRERRHEVCGGGEVLKEEGPLQKWTYSSFIGKIFEYKPLQQMHLKKKKKKISGIYDKLICDTILFYNQGVYQGTRSVQGGF